MPSEVYSETTPSWVSPSERVTATSDPIETAEEMGRATAIFPSRERTTRPPYWAVTAAALSPSPAQTSFTRPETPAFTLAETLSSALSLSCSSKSSS